jgi:hypothetical protein
MPRHPPYALNSLTTFIQSSRLEINATRYIYFPDLHFSQIYSLCVAVRLGVTLELNLVI